MVVAEALEATVSSTLHISICKMQMIYLRTSSEARILLQISLMMMMISSVVVALVILSEVWEACMEVWVEVWVEEWVVVDQKVRRRIEIHLEVWVWEEVLEIACSMMMTISSVEVLEVVE